MHWWLNVYEGAVRVEPLVLQMPTVLAQPSQNSVVQARSGRPSALRSIPHMSSRSDIPQAPGVTDLEIDRYLPDAHRWVSRLFWTPLEVVERGVAWLDELSVGDVLDVGSGVGKWCVGAALVDDSSRRYFGLEHRADLVTIASGLAASFGVADRVTFHVGEVINLLHTPGPIAHLPAAPAFYFFNPFGENTAPDDEHLDAAVELSEERFHRDVAAAEDLLEVAPRGTWVLVYNGFGGRMPDAYEPVRTDYDGFHVLRLWRKR